MYRYSYSHIAAKDDFLTPMLCLTVDWLLGVAWVFLQNLLIDSLQLRAAQLSDDSSDSVSKLGERTEKNVWLRLGRELVNETAKIIALEKSL